MKHFYILALDSSGGACTACVYNMGTDTVLSSAYVLMPYGQAECIMPMVDTVVTQAGVQKSAVQAVATCNGPGYFTGIRIGLSTAQGLALGLGARLYAVSSLQAMAFEVQNTIQNTGQKYRAFTVIMETKRKDFYVQSFDGITPTTDIACAVAEHITPHPHIVGSGVQRYMQSVHTHAIALKPIDCPPYPHAISIARAIAHRTPNMDNGADNGVEPLYCRPPDVHPPQKGGV